VLNVKYMEKAECSMCLMWSIWTVVLTGVTLLCAYQLNEFFVKNYEQAIMKP
jgi:hypothetical protein